MDGDNKNFSEEQNFFDESQNNFKDEGSGKLPIEVILRQPIEYKTKTIEKIIFRNMPDMESIMHIPMSLEQWKFGHFVPIISKMTGETMDTIKKLSSVDAAKAIGIASDFLALE